MPRPPILRQLSASTAILWSIAAACAPTGPEQATLAILDVNVITMRGEAVLADHMVVIGGDRAERDLGGRIGRSQTI